MSYFLRADPDSIIYPEIDYSEKKNKWLTKLMFTYTCDAFSMKQICLYIIVRMYIIFDYEQ